VTNRDPGALPESKTAVGADLIIPALAAAFTLYFLIDSANLVWEARANGTLIGVTVLAMILIQLFRIAVKLREGTATLSLGEFARMSSGHAKRIAVLAVLIVFIATVPWLGTTLGLLLTMAALMWILGVRDPKVLVGAAAATAGTVYLLFIAFLKTQLPVGLIEHLLQKLFGAG
jgi:hypothetical protein